MSPKPENYSKYFTLAVIIFLIGLFLFLVLSGPIIGNVFSAINSNLVPTVIPTSSGPTDLANLDQILKQAMRASLAYNAPETMKLDETGTIQLLLNPSVTEEELARQIENGNAVTTGTVEITPLMKAELKAQDPQAFLIVPLHDSDEQPVGTTETTRWEWDVTAKKGGLQRLTLVVYRLIKYDGKDYWREVETYKADITVEVTFQQRLQAFDWKWLGGLLLTSLIIPLFLRWWDKRKAAKPSAKKHQTHP